MIIGYSTGSLRKIVDPVSPEAISVCKELGCNAIEFGCGTIERLKRLDIIRKQNLESFEHISIHAPEIDCGKIEQKRILNIIEDTHQRLNFDCVVIHPSRVIDWDIFDRYSFPVAIENMDWRKNSFKSVASFGPLMEKYNYYLTLDINHCYTNDKTMESAKQFYDQYQSRISEYHISGYTEEDIHKPLYISQQTEILDAIPEGPIPMIIETGYDNIEEARIDISYIKNYLSEKYAPNR